MLHSLGTDLTFQDSYPRRTFVLDSAEHPLVPQADMKVYSHEPRRQIGSGSSWTLERS